MRLVILGVSIFAAILLISGCEQSEERALEKPETAKSKVVKKETSEVPTSSPIEEMTSVISATKKAITQAIPTEASSSIKKSGDPKSLFTSRCQSCHGVDGEKKALGRSNIIAGQSESDLKMKLDGYKKGTYGGDMKSLMKVQIKTISQNEINALSTYISKL